tara:strand:+ start:157 stop:558 length:402 start_codon:yes stop_codon:yes gene_type:complete
MRLVFDLDGVICTPPKGIQFGIVEYIEHSLPLYNAIEFMQWLKGKGHEITIWCDRPNDLAVKFATEQWLDLHQVPYNRLMFDRPKNPIYVTETPSNSKYFGNIGDNNIVSILFEEWKEWKQKEEKELETSVPT